MRPAHRGTMHRTDRRRRDGIGDGSNDPGTLPSMTRMQASFALSSRSRLACLASIACALLMSGCASFYVDPALPRAGKDSFPAVKASQPVQFLYEFKTRGVVNARATESTRNHAVAAVESSGLFLSVSSVPVDGPKLSVVIDNVPITSESDAMGKGFVTGLTFGLIGSNVTDGYIAAATLDDGRGDVRSARAQHAIHATIGLASPPAGLTAVPAGQAVREVVEQLILHLLKDLKRQP